MINVGDVWFFDWTKSNLKNILWKSVKIRDQKQPFFLVGSCDLFFFFSEVTLSWGKVLRTSEATASGDWCWHSFFSLEIGPAATLQGTKISPPESMIFLSPFSGICDRFLEGIWIMIVRSYMSTYQIPSSQECYLHMEKKRVVKENLNSNLHTKINL